MTRTRGLALLVTVAAAGAFVHASSGPAERTATVSGARLKTISSRVGAKSASLVIEATDPVAYIATRPDPLTVVVDMRNVVADGVSNAVAANARSPIQQVVVEPGEAADAPAWRIRVALREPVAYHVRSERNTIVLDFDRPTGDARPAVRPVASRPAIDPVQALGLGGEPKPPLPAPATPAPVTSLLQATPLALQASGSVTVPAPAQACQAVAAVG